MKIVKTAKSKWDGNGFGHSGASWGVAGKPNIRILRDNGAWYGFIGTQKFFALSKQDLEAALSAGAAA